MNTDLINVEKNIAPLKERLLSLASDSLKLTVHDEESQKIAGAKILAVRDAIKVVEFEKKSWTEPLEAQKKRLIGIFKSLLNELYFADGHLKQQLGAYFMKQKELEAKEQERLEKLAQKRFDKAVENGKPTPFPIAISPKVDMVNKSVQTEAGKVTYIIQKKIHIPDITKVPHFYKGVQLLFPNSKGIQGLLDAGETVPGVEIKEESYIRG